MEESLVLRPLTRPAITDSQRFGTVLGREYSAPFLDELDWVPGRTLTAPVYLSMTYGRTHPHEPSTLRVVTHSRAIPEPHPTFLLVFGLACLAWEGRRRTRQGSGQGAKGARSMRDVVLDFS